MNFHINDITLFFTVITAIVGISTIIIVWGRASVAKANIELLRGLVNDQTTEIHSLREKVETLSNNYKSSEDMIKQLRINVDELKKEMNSKDVLIVTALKEYFKENPKVAVQSSKPFSEVLKLNK